jgi:hypothetical protein
MLIGAVVPSLAQTQEQILQQKLSENSFQNVQVTSVSKEKLYDKATLAKATHFMNISFLLFRKAGWTKEIVVSHLRQIARIYNTDECRILVEKAYIAEINPIPGSLDIDVATVYSQTSKISGADLRLAKKLPPELPRPVIGLLRNTYDQTMDAYSGAQYAVENSFRKPLLNTSWVANFVNTPTYISHIPKGYDVIAHELAHLLGNTGHNLSIKPNILNDDVYYINDKILPEQCEEFVQSPLVRSNQ